MVFKCPTQVFLLNVDVKANFSHSIAECKEDTAVPQILKMHYCCQQTVFFWYFLSIPSTTNINISKYLSFM